MTTTTITFSTTVASTADSSREPLAAGRGGPIPVHPDRYAQSGLNKNSKVAIAFRKALNNDGTLKEEYTAQYLAQVASQKNITIEGVADLMNDLSCAKPLIQLVQVKMLEIKGHDHSITELEEDRSSSEGFFTPKQIVAVPKASGNLLSVAYSPNMNASATVLLSRSECPRYFSVIQAEEKGAQAEERVEKILGAQGSESSNATTRGQLRLSNSALNPSTLPVDLRGTGWSETDYKAFVYDMYNSPTHNLRNIAVGEAEKEAAAGFNYIRNDLIEINKVRNQLLYEMIALVCFTLALGLFVTLACFIPPVGAAAVITGIIWIATMNSIRTDFAKLRELNNQEAEKRINLHTIFASTDGMIIRDDDLTQLTPSSHSVESSDNGPDLQ